MANHSNLLLLSLIIFLTSSLIEQTLAVQYIVTNNASNTPGGHRFDTEIGVPFTIQTMKSINSFIWKLFKQNTEAERKNVPILNLYITVLNDGAFGETGGDNSHDIYISAAGLQSSAPGQARFFFSRVLCHEMTHIFQWSGRGTAPGGLTEGIAEYAVMKSEYFKPISDGYTKPGEGRRWDEGYGVTARFLEYCDGLREGFTVELNKKMREVYKDEYFLDLLGKPLDQVWREYKAKYGNPPTANGGDYVSSDYAKY